LRPTNPLAKMPRPTTVTRVCFMNRIVSLVVVGLLLTVAGCSSDAPVTTAAPVELRSGFTVNGLEIGPGAILYGADLTRADLRNADLTLADLTGANLYGANLMYADLSGTTLTGADLRCASLALADLTNAYLSDAIQYGVDLICE
jgi:hypothetical protein